MTITSREVTDMPTARQYEKARLKRERLLWRTAIAMMKEAGIETLSITEFRALLQQAESVAA